ncbi:MAG: hypothetical protein AMJ81_08150 [Phycisphaerae bacterium SM23_33]|jgi:hypothetical protein|nr:MAG: hypothetical protein AMJ81_08150 [Phycisphaerae bacterium SM23_33]
MNEERVSEGTRLDVTSPDRLDALMDIVHDEAFELDDVTFSPQQGIVEIPYRRIFHGAPSRTIRNWLIFKDIEVDVVRAMLRIHHVSDFSFEDTERIGTYSFNIISYDGRQLKIVCCEPLELKMTVSRLFIQSRYLGVRGKARIRQGLFWESWRSQVYD